MVDKIDLDLAQIAAFSERERIKESQTPLRISGVKEPGEKPTNPKDAVGIKKVPFSTIPMEVVAEIGIGMMEGAMKYGRHNYRAIGVRGSVYFDATMRHLVSWWEGEDIDPDSGLSHISKAITSLVVLRDSMLNGNLNDDRPPKLPEEWIKPLNEKATNLVEKYPNPKQAYTEI